MINVIKITRKQIFIHLDWEQASAWSSFRKTNKQMENTVVAAVSLMFDFCWAQRTALTSGCDDRWRPPGGAVGVCSSPAIVDTSTKVRDGQRAHTFVQFSYYIKYYCYCCKDIYIYISIFLLRPGQTCWYTQPKVWRRIQMSRFWWSKSASQSHLTTWSLLELLI